MPDSGRSPSGSGSSGLSPIFRISINGNDAIAAACGWLAHSAMLRTMPPRTAGGDDRLLEFERVPTGDGAAHRITALLAAEYTECGGAVVREVRVDIAPPAVFGRIHTHHLIAFVSDLGAVDFEVMAAAQRSHGLPQIDRSLLAPAAAQFPQIGGCEPGRGKSRGAGRTDAERGRQDRVGAAADLDVFQPVLGPAGNRQDRAQRVIGHFCSPSQTDAC